MKQYNGAVFFVDMLGVGALTQNQVPLNEKDFSAWKFSEESKLSANLFCAQLLMKFRFCLKQIQKNHKSVQVAQLSDCAYIWSKDVLSVAEAARAFMWHSVESGLLCRGGLAYGEIVEPDKVDRALGQFVLGGAVTKAVGFENAGKGCRIFTDAIVGEKLTSTRSSPFRYLALEELKNPLDGSIVDEFCWYRTGGIDNDWRTDGHAAAKQILTLISLLKYSPRFSWNEATSHGRIQLACSIEAISRATTDFICNEDYVFRSEFYLAAPWETDGPIINRSIKTQVKVLEGWLNEIEPLFSKQKRRPLETL